MKLLSIVKPSHRLILIRHCAPLKSRLFWLQAVTGVAVMVLLAWVFTSRGHPVVGLAAGVGLVVLLVLAARAAEMKRAAQQDESICFDRDANAILQNGQPVAMITDMDHILVRRIMPDAATSEDEPIDYALVISLGNSKKITLAETYGVPGGKEQIEQAASEIAEFAGVPVQVGERRQTEYWMDMS